MIQMGCGGDVPGACLRLPPVPLCILLDFIYEFGWYVRLGASDVNCGIGLLDSPFRLNLMTWE